MMTTIAGLSATAKVSIIVTMIGSIVALVKLILQIRASREAAKDARESAAQAASIQRDNAERMARHAKESASAEAERKEKEEIMAQLRKQTDDTLAILKTELASQQTTNAKTFELLDRNTRATEKLAEAVAGAGDELRLLASQVAEIKGGAGCRARQA